ncbi:MAG: CehA/McbA family metallohydrolase [Bryobacterales bacterium]|nr:CehA/McbA family metallohydrolase [Bryobacterales bacterium]
MNLSLRAALVFCLVSIAAAQAPERSRHAGGYMYNYYVPQTASTPWRPSWSPDGKHIVFAMSGSLWRIDVGDTTAYELTANRTYDSAPVYSPDGRWIVYSTEDNQGVNLMLYNVATAESTVLTKGSQLHLDPAWSPDGKRLAYVASEDRNRFHIFAMPLENGKPGAPMRLTEPNSFGRGRLYFAEYDDHIQPTWSPDGSELILVSNRNIPLGSGAIYRAKPERDMMRSARMILREETLYRTNPQWSADGKRILYSSHRGGQFSNLYVLPVDGGEPYKLTFGEYDHFDAKWSPDGEWIVFIANEHGNSDMRLLRTFGGEQRKIEIRRRVHRRPMGTLEVHLRDAPTGKPEAARIYLRASDGKSYAPEKEYHRIAGRAANRDFFHADGHFRLEVPVGEVTIEAARGIEYWPERQTAAVRENATTIVSIDLRRMAHMKARGWYSGSDHVHMNYGGNQNNTPENLVFMAKAEDLDVIGEKVANKDNRIFDQQHFTGKPHHLTTSERILEFGEEYRPPFYGHVNFINMKKHLISPFTTGYEGTAIESLYPSNTDMFRLARQQGAIGGYVHPFSGDPPSRGYSVARGFPVDLALGSFEYIELMTSAGHYTHTADVWHRALNCGFKVTASAGEDSILNLHATAILGSSRLYAYLGPKLTWDGWVEAIRKGRTFVTNGPLLEFTVNGEMAGEEIQLPAGGGAVDLAATMESIVPVKTVEVLFNGKVLETVPLTEGGKRAVLRKRVQLPSSGWLTVRAKGDPAHPIDDSYVVAETGAIYVIAGGQPIRSREDAEYFITWIDDITRQAQEHPGWRSDKERQHVLGQFAEARRIFEQRAREAGR